MVARTSPGLPAREAWLGCGEVGGARGHLAETRRDPQRRQSAARPKLGFRLRKKKEERETSVAAILAHDGDGRPRAGQRAASRREVEDKDHFPKTPWVLGKLQESFKNRPLALKINYLRPFPQ